MDQFFDETEVLKEIQKINSQVTEELSKDNVDNKKLYNLRFQQLMKGIQLTQNPYDILR